MKQNVVLWLSFWFLFKIIGLPLKSQEISLSDLQVGWEAYEKIASEYVYEVVEYRNGSIDETKKVSRKGKSYLVTRLGSNNTSIFGKNDIYVFNISKRDASEQLMLESVIPVGEYYDNNLKAQYGRNSLLTPPEFEIIFGLKTKHVFSDGWARIDKIELSSDSSEVVIEFELEKNDQSLNINQAKLKNGRAIFRNDRFFLPKRLEFIPSTGADSDFSETVTLTNQFVEFDQIPRLTRQTLEYSDGYLIEYQFNYLDEKLSNRDFTLSAFGFPEPPFARRTFFSQWVVLFGSSAIVLGIFILMYFSKRRKF